MDNPRIAALSKLLEHNPEDPRARFGLAAEYEREGRWPDVVRELRHYLSLAEDQGNAWGRLGHALREMGRDEEAREAFRRGREAALAHDHPSMAAEFDAILDEWDG